MNYGNDYGIDNIRRVTSLPDIIHEGIVSDSIQKEFMCTSLVPIG